VRLASEGAEASAPSPISASMKPKREFQRIVMITTAARVTIGFLKHGAFKIAPAKN
jgi:hypothetical protein